VETAALIESFMPTPVPEFGVTFQNDGSINVSCSSVAEAKLAIRRLKLKKKEYALNKKEIMTELARLRAEHQINLGRQGSMMRGGGSIGKFVRDMQHMSRDRAKRNYVSELDPLEKKKTALARRMMIIDDAVVQVEQYVLENTEP
jgi:hypothetical protein